MTVQGADNSTEASRREAYIRKYIMPEYNQGTVTNIAKQMKYMEKFADNYELDYMQTPFFDTSRQFRPGNSWAPPCAKPEDPPAGGSGSRFWSMPIECSVTGPLSTVKDKCNPPVGDGLDGCTSAPPSQWSLDTEPESLRERWAWGFGHLRRSVATLGVVTGALANGMMSLENVYFSAAENVAANYGTSGFSRPDQTIGQAEPGWARRFWGGEARCVWPLAGPQAYDQNPGVQTSTSAIDTYRQYSGRPVNENGFIPPWYTTGYVGLSGLNSVATYTGHADILYGFPRTCDGPTDSQCRSIGVDPQMPYCALPSPDEYLHYYDQWGSAAQVSWPETVQGPLGPVSKDFSSGYIGIATARPVQLNSDWSAQIDDMWAHPGPDEHFCDAGFKTSPPYRYAVWRALCNSVSETPDQSNGAPVDASAEFKKLRGQPGFMKFGRVEDPAAPATPYADAHTVGNWLASSTQPESAQYLFDLRPQKGITGADFQYPLTARNIFDALELACHVNNLAGAPSGCDSVDAFTLQTGSDQQIFDQLQGSLDCLAARANRAVSSYVFGPTSKELVNQFTTGQALSNTSNTGGQYRQDLSSQYQALTRIAQDYSHLSDAGRGLVVIARQLALIHVEKNQSALANKLSQASAALTAVAQVLQLAAEGTSVKLGSAYEAGAMVATAAAGVLTVKSLQAQLQAQNAGEDQKLLDQVNRAAEWVNQARDAASDIPIALNSLGNASADLALVRKKAQLALARINFSGYAGASGEDPQYVNVANRRIYNTKLIRYERALHRARQLAFIARRAIELRFGVDFDHMQRDMTLVQAPAKWANDVCTMEGIDYAKIRSPNPAQPVSGYNFGDTPIPGDEFANAYIGDYVDKLQDFVNSYPIDYPLKDGDDVAVLSMADDIFAAEASCSEPGRNLLYYSTEFDKNDNPADKVAGHGWYVEGCSGVLSDGTSWDGCVQASPIEEEVVDQSELPKGAVVHRLINKACIPASVPAGTPDGCPHASPYSAEGEVVQGLGTLQIGHYVASVYVHVDAGRSADGAKMRVVTGSAAGTPVAGVGIEPTGPGWARVQLEFTVTTPGQFWLEFLPSSQSTTPPSSGSGMLLGDDGAAWPGLLLAAAQVEEVFVTAGRHTHES